MSGNTISIASDHGGRVLKHKLCKKLIQLGYEVRDHGVSVDEARSVDYPDYANKVVKDILSEQSWRGILVCGTGIGMSMSANRHTKIRATLVWDEFTTRMSRAHNDSNLLVLGERVLNQDRALDYLDIWLNTEFETRHQHRLAKLDQNSSPCPDSK